MTPSDIDTLVVQAPDPSPWLLDYQPITDSVVAGDTAMFRAMPAPAPAAPPPPPAAKADDYIAPILESLGNFTTEFEVPARGDYRIDGAKVHLGLAAAGHTLQQNRLEAAEGG